MYQSKLTVCQELGRWIANLEYDSIPAPVRSEAKLHLLDSIAALLAGSRVEEAPLVAEAFHAVEGQGDVKVVPQGSTMPLLGAAATQASLNNLAELDDVHGESSFRPGAIVVPVLLGLSQVQSCSGQSMLLGMLAGYEVGPRVGRALATHHLLARGLWPSSILGPLSAAAAAAKMLDFSAEDTANALAIAGLLAGGLVTGTAEGPTARHIVFGYAARNGLSAALAARAGMTGPTRLFEDQRSFFRAFGDDDAGGAMAQAAVKGLGQGFELERTGFKFYPCARQTHAALDALGGLLADHRLAAADLKAIDVWLPSSSIPIVDKPNPPGNRLGALSSVQFVLAARAVRGRLTVSELGEAGRRDPEVLEMQQQVQAHADEALTQLGMASARVRVQTRGGDAWESSLRAPFGDIDNPATPEQAQKKFFQEAQPVLGVDRAQKVHDLVQNLESLTDSRPLLELLATRPQANE